MATKLKQPTTAEWKRLYELAAKLKELAPWEWMTEADIFGVENPETKEIGFVSTMGTLGEHLAIGVYRGAEGLYGFWEMQEIGADADPFLLFEVPQLQVSFENREQLEKQDRDLIKKLGLKFRGKQNYPLFRSIIPNFLPWFISSEEAQMLIYAIQQTLEVAPRFREDEDLLIDESGCLLIRTAEKKDGKLVWRDERREIPPPEEKEFTIDVPQELVDELKGFPVNEKFILEMDLFYAPTPVGEKNKRPYFPKMLMLADATSGMIAGFEMIQPKEDEIENFVEIGRHIIESLHKLNIRPKEIRVASETLLELLEVFNQDLNIKLKRTENLSAIEAAKEGLFGFLGDTFF